MQLDDLKFYKSATVNDSGTNGGKISAVEVVSGAAKNLFDAISDSERLAGSTKYRKLFCKVADPLNGIAQAVRLWLDKYTSGADRVTFFPTTQTSTQAAITGSERQYGAGKLNASVSAGVSTIAVLCEAGNTGIFQDGDTIRISDKADVDSLTGNEEFKVVTGTPGVAGDVVTLNLTTTLTNAYLEADTRVASVYDHPSDVEPTFDNFSVSSVGDGDYNSAQLTLENEGTVEDTWTITFTNATNFDISGASTGSVGTGTTAAGAAPNNPDFSSPYFTLASAGFSGTWQAGDTISFQTHPAAVPVFMKRVCPAAAAVQEVNSAEIAFDLETA